MRTRFALVAAVAACIVIFSAAVASAVVTTGKTSLRGARHALGRAGKNTAQFSSFLAPRTSIVSLQRARAFESRRLRRNVVTSPKPAPAPVAAPAAPPAPPAPVPQPVVAAQSFTDATSTTTPDWACIRDHESDDNYAENSGNGYSGAYQFLPSTWNEAVSGAGYSQYANGEAFEAPPSIQNAAALWLYNLDGWSPWSTRYVCGL